MTERIYAIHSDEECERLEAQAHLVPLSSHLKGNYILDSLRCFWHRLGRQGGSVLAILVVTSLGLLIPGYGRGATISRNMPFGICGCPSPCICSFGNAARRALQRAPISADVKSSLWAAAVMPHGLPKACVSGVRKECEDAGRAPCAEISHPADCRPPRSHALTQLQSGHDAENRIWTLAGGASAMALANAAASTIRGDESRLVCNSASAARSLAAAASFVAWAPRSVASASFTFDLVRNSVWI